MEKKKINFFKQKGSHYANTNCLGRNAFYVENITQFPGEKEFLFPCGTEFFINGVLEN